MAAKFGLKPLTQKKLAPARTATKIKENAELEELQKRVQVKLITLYLSILQCLHRLLIVDVDLNPNWANFL